MTKRKKKLTAGGVAAAVLGFACALAAAALFYGAMVYQLAGEPAQDAQEAEAAGGVLALSSGSLVGETVDQMEVGGALCTLTARTYALPDGTQARAMTASPAAYIERLSDKDVQVQPITGFVIDDLDAVYALRGEVSILAARSGDTVYMIEGALDQQALYELGALSKRAPI